MQYVVLGEHSAEVCPSSNAKTRALMMEVGPQIAKIAEQNNVKIIAGPLVNREHTTVVIAETDQAENLDAFLVESRLSQWNRIRILPSLPVEEAMADINNQTALF